MSIKRMVLCLSIVPLLLASGCVATLGKNTVPEIQSLRNRVSALEREVRIKDQEIDSLKDALNTKRYVRRSLAPEIKSRPKAKQIQTALKNAGYYQGAIDGKIGKQSRKAIRKFQKDNGLKVDGKVGKRTWAVLGKYL